MTSLGLRPSCVIVIAAVAVLGGCGRPDGHPFGSKPLADHALRGTLYHLKKGADRIPDFARLQPRATLFATHLDADVANDVNGFQGVTDHNEWFAFDYVSRLKVEREGTYGFRLNSDDGSRLLIDGKGVIDNDGVHPAPVSKSGQAALTAGDHQVELQYFKGPHYHATLQAYCTAPGGTEALFPDCGGLSLETPTKLADHVWWLWLVGLVAVGGGWWFLAGRRRA